jgi:hypothetical protein
MCSERVFRFHMPFVEFGSVGFETGFPFPRFSSRRSYLRRLEAYKAELEEEVRAINEEIEELKRGRAEA